MYKIFVSCGVRWGVRGICDVVSALKVCVMCGMCVGAWYVLCDERLGCACGVGT